MKVLAIDIGGKSRNGICLMEDSIILDSSYIIYDHKNTPMYHRQKILSEIKRYLGNYINIDYIIFERINLYRGPGISPLANILSLCRLQTTLIDNLSDEIDIYDVTVKSWKSRVLGKGTATKEDSVKFVSENYPKIDIKISEGIYNHDLCDAICIAYAACNNPDMPKQKLNYK